LIAGLILLHFLPTMIGIVRRVESLGLLLFLNMLPTGVGWIGAMVMAFMSPRREPPLTYVARRCPPSISRLREATGNSSAWLGVTWSLAMSA
jgi:hypothetical protein